MASEIMRSTPTDLTQHNPGGEPVAGPSDQIILAAFKFATVVVGAGVLAKVSSDVTKIVGASEKSEVTYGSDKHTVDVKITNPGKGPSLTPGLCDPKLKKQIDDIGELVGSNIGACEVKILECS